MIALEQPGFVVGWNACMRITTVLAYGCRRGTVCSHLVVLGPAVLAVAYR
jgi:hypothetical protein